MTDQPDEQVGRFPGVPAQPDPEVPEPDVSEVADDDSDVIEDAAGAVFGAPDEDPSRAGTGEDPEDRPQE